MKRLAVLLTVILVALTATPAIARVSVDPVSALKAQFATNRGVTIVERSITKGVVAARVRTLAQFGRSGVIASDQTFMTLSYGDEPQHMRRIFVGGREYTQGNFFNEAAPRLPEDKQWLLVKGKARPEVGFLQLVNVLEPGTLNLLLTSASSVRRDRGERLYAGVVAIGDIRKVSPLLKDIFAGTDRYNKAKMNWRLWINAKGLVSRLVTWQEEDSSSSPVKIDTRFSGWRSGVKVEAPPAAEVATKELEETE
jgi:hypothetical protein